jgi:hypothetical protein
MLFHETLVLARPVTTEVSLATLHEERRWVRGYRWWTLEERHSTDEAILPADLAALVEAVIGVISE